MSAPRLRFAPSPGRASVRALVFGLVASLLALAPATAFADEDPAPPAEHAGSAEDHAAPAPAADEHPAPAPAAEEHPAAAPADEHPAGAPAPAEDHAAPAPVEEPTPSEGTEAGDPVPYVEFDADGDGKVEPEERALQQEYQAAFAGMPDEVTDAELDKRAEGQQLVPSLTADQLRAMTKLARGKVLGRLQAKMERSAAARMGKISALIRWFSLAGLLLLAMPLVLRKKYPGQGAMLLKYSALAAVTFVVTVNLFGMVVLGFRGAQAGLGQATNPQLRIASGFFDTIDRNAEDYLVMGKELFAPTLERLQGNSDEQPAAILIENGTKIVKDAQVFLTIAKAFKKVDFVFAALPVVLLMVTMLLFVLAIRPTLMEIIRLPMTVAGGAATDRAAAGKQVVKRAIHRVVGELVATLGTLGVLVVITLLAGAVLGRVVAPALDALIAYFQLGISYLQFVQGASSALVFGMLFAVILFLVINLGVVIASMAFYLGKAQKIFQRRFTDGVPLATHARFWKWGSASVLLAQLLPLIYLVIAGWGLDKINEKLTAGVTDASQIPWTAIMLIGPVFLVAGFLVVLWAARGFKALAFLARYKVPPAPAPSAAP